MLHAHTYFPYSTDEDKAQATKFRAAVQSQFEGMDGVKISTISPEAVGPHPMPEFELAFTKYCLKDILPWLVFNRPVEYSILVHPFTSDVVSSLPQLTKHVCMQQSLNMKQQSLDLRPSEHIPCSAHQICCMIMP